MRPTRQQLQNLKEVVFRAYNAIICQHPRADSQPDLIIDNVDYAAIWQLMGFSKPPKRPQDIQHDASGVEDCEGGLRWCASQWQVNLDDQFIDNASNALRKAWRAKHKSARYPSRLFCSADQLQAYFRYSKGFSQTRFREATQRLRRYREDWDKSLSPQLSTSTNQHSHDPQYPIPQYIVYLTEKPYSYDVVWPHDERRKSRTVTIKERQKHFRRLMDLICERFQRIKDLDLEVTPKQLQHCFYFSIDGKTATRVLLTRFRQFWISATDDDGAVICHQKKSPGIQVINMVVTFSEDKEERKQRLR